MERRLLELKVQNFKSLREVSLALNEFNVMVGPNGAGKTNVLEVFRFLADIIRTDLPPAIADRGGFDELAFWGGDHSPDFIQITLRATWTAHSSVARPDEYSLRINQSDDAYQREESFRLRRGPDAWRRILVRDQRSIVFGLRGDEPEFTEHEIGISPLSSGLSTLPRLTDEEGGVDVEAFAHRLASFRVYDVSVNAARRPSRVPSNGGRDFYSSYPSVGGSRRQVNREPLADDAANLAAFLLGIRATDEASWERLVADAREVLPQLDDIDFYYPSGAAREVVVVLRERGLRLPTQLADASYGTIRLLGLLAMLYDPDPPALTCIEEVDHGLHPQALELVVERLREASARTQFLIATHSPTFADRLRPGELVVCERSADGSSAIPAISVDKVERIVAESEGLPLGELWFSGALGGDL